ncbi:MAG TPA: sigma-70 family RNA polymerase sigma factor, partial [Vicinamibacterales bacterium]
MSTRDLSLSDADHLALDASGRPADALAMDDEAFRVFYEQTARPLWRFLARATGDRAVADDLFQETYYRLLRSTTPFASDEHRRHYLFRIAVNLLRDRHRRTPPESPLPDAADAAHPRDERAALRLAQRRDVDRAMNGLRARDRLLLQLAYTLGLSHAEIAGTLGL